jgi:gluconate 2-dehydrogenase gamma chain
MKKNDLHRRRFIQMAALVSGGVLLFPRCTNLPIKSPWRFFTEEEASLVDAIIEQIIPADEWPGAKEAGVTNFIDKQLIGPYVRHQEKYRNSLFAVEASCKELYQRQFEKLSWEEQTGFLKKMEAGKLMDLLKAGKTGQQKNKIWEVGFDRTFFNLIVDHTMQGFYGSPRHGGNKNYVSYKMIGLDYPFTIGQNRYKS